VLIVLFAPRGLVSVYRQLIDTFGARGPPRSAAVEGDDDVSVSGGEK
jgi:hypothetical protein